ncbi:hypothetical protein PR048_001830 [Dryococelus australis]|uniref:Astakine n=1 Tax=Dryococelus australis TaxID=614101 RepID=A0ABQ9IIM3_9NEOP|nr:hypothetical protein PR048_001830 [Dryococelus australis]
MLRRCCDVAAPIRYSYPVCSAFGQKGATCRPSARPFNTNLHYPDGLVANVSNAHYIMCPCAPGFHCNLGTCVETVPPHNSLEER